MVTLRRFIPGHDDPDDMWVLPEIPAPKPHAARPEPTLIDRILPRHDVGGVAKVTIDASPQVVFEALRNVTLGEIRGIPLLARLGRRPGGVPGEGNASARTFLQATNALPLGETPDRECVFGYVGTLHDLRDRRLVDLPDLFTFMRFNDPGYEKLAISFQAAPLPDGRTRLIADHRTLALGPSTRRKLTLAWYSLAGWYGRLILRQLLAATKRRAETAPHRTQES